jgi:hypothetical protein
VPNATEILSGQPNAKNVGEHTTFAVSDISDPILQPWAREELRKLNGRVLAGMPLFSKHASCWPMGVPGFLLYPVAPICFVQTPKENAPRLPQCAAFGACHAVLVRRIRRPLRRRNAGRRYDRYERPHLIDEYRTPHTDRLDVIERFHIIEGGKTLEVNLHLENPGAFTTPWDAIQRYRRVEGSPMDEETCAEGARDYFGQEAEPIPQANKPDF